MKACFQRDIAVVQTVGIEVDTGTARGTAEEVHDPSLANHLNRPFPGSRAGNSFDHGIGTTPLKGERSGCLNDIFHGGRLNDLRRSKELCGGDLIIALDYGNYPEASQLGDVHEHEANRTCTDDHHGVPGPGVRLLQAAYNTRKWLGKSGVFERNMSRNQQCVFSHDPGRDPDVFSVGSVVEQQIFAKVLLTAEAEEASIARRRIQRNDAIPFVESGDSLSNFSDYTGYLVAEQDGRLEHHGVIPTAVNFQIGSAGQSGTYADDQLTGLSAGNRNPFQAEVFLPIQNRRIHLTSHPYYLLISRVLIPIP